MWKKGRAPEATWQGAWPSAATCWRWHRWCVSAQVPVVRGHIVVITRLFWGNRIISCLPCNFSMLFCFVLIWHRESNWGPCTCLAGVYAMSYIPGLPYVLRHPLHSLVVEDVKGAIPHGFRMYCTLLHHNKPLRQHIRYNLASVNTKSLLLISSF